MLHDTHRVAIMAADSDAVLGDNPDLLPALKSHGVTARCILTNAGAGGNTGGNTVALEAQGASVLQLEPAAGTLGLLHGATATHHLTGLLRTEKPDTVVICGRRLPLAAAVAARMARCGNVVLLLPCLGARLLNGRAERDWARRQAPLRRLQAAVNCCHSVVFQNRRDARMLEHAGILPSRLRLQVLSGPGVDCERLAPLALPSVGGRIRFVMAATNLTLEAIADFSAAARTVQDEMQHLTAGKVDFAIWNPASEHDETAAALLARSPVIRLASAMPASDAIAWGHVLAVVDHGAGVAREMTQALALGRALIVSASPGCSDLVDERVNGIIIHPGTSSSGVASDGLAAAMASLARRPDLLPAMARASRQKAERNYAQPLLRRALLEALRLGAKKARVA